MATLRALIVEPDGSTRKTEIENELGAFQAVVGGYIEPVCGRVATIYVNEEGLLRHLPPNPLATLFANRVLKAPVQLFGTALILGPTEHSSDTHVRQSVVSHFALED